MTKLKKIWIHENKPQPVASSRYELRLDWDNDRHQAIAMAGMTPDAVREAMLRMVHLIVKDQQNECL